MRRKKLLRQVAAAAVALSMAVSLSAPAFAATFDLSNGGLVIKADESGITVTQDGKTGSTSIKDDEEIVITGTYNSTGGATQTAEENQQMKPACRLRPAPPRGDLGGDPGGRGRPRC